MLRGSLYWLLAALVLSGCAGLSPEMRRASAGQMAAGKGWESVYLQAGGFVLAAFLPRQLPAVSDTLSVYIEGDGLAWVTPSRISSDPTPEHPVGLELALGQPRGIAVCLARPCQYVEGAEVGNCSSIWWTDRRFAPEVVDAASMAVDQLKQRFQARNLELIGYSGGGAIAALVAARRQDVVRLITVAGNLDHQVWTRLHQVSPLTGSLNPADDWQALAGIPQVHFVGGQDRNITREVTASYLSRFPAGLRPQLRVIEGFDHACCWAEQWPELYPRE